MRKKPDKILEQLHYDFPGNRFDYQDTYLVVNGQKLWTIMPSEEIAALDPLKANSRAYYQLFCNMIYNRFHLRPRPGSYADRLIIDEEESRKSAIAGWLEEHRIGMVEGDRDIMAVEYEIDGDPLSLKRIEYDADSDDAPPRRPWDRTPEEQAAWEAEMRRLAMEGEEIKAEFQEKDEEERGRDE